MTGLRTDHGNYCHLGGAEFPVVWKTRSRWFSSRTMPPRSRTQSSAANHRSGYHAGRRALSAANEDAALGPYTAERGCRSADFSSGFDQSAGGVAHKDAMLADVRVESLQRCAVAVHGERGRRGGRSERRLRSATGGQDRDQRSDHAS